MTNLADHMKEMLKDMEKFKQRIMRNINELEANEEAVVRTTVYPMAKVNPLMINNYPVFQFSYEGMLPLYKEDDYEYLSMIRHYYYRSTFDSYDYSKLTLPVMSKVMIIFVHYFEDRVIRDLDNRNKMYIQDAIRQTRIFGNDDWKNVWNMDIAFLDKERNHVQVYVVERKNHLDFLNYLYNNHKNLKDKTRSVKLYVKEYFKKMTEKKQKKSVKTTKKPIKTSSVKDVPDTKKPLIITDDTLW